MAETINRLIAGIPVELIEAPPGVNIACEACFKAEATHAVGVSDHRVVCEPCLDHGDRRCWWNLAPRQAL